MSLSPSWPVPSSVGAVAGAGCWQQVLRLGGELGLSPRAGSWVCSNRAAAIHATKIKINKINKNFELLMVSVSAAVVSAPDLRAAPGAPA